MNFQILCDGCCDLTQSERGSSVFTVVPPEVTVAGQSLTPDTAPQALLEQLETGREVQVVFPDAQAYLDAMDPTAEAIYLVTASEKLGGQYEAASRARRLLLYSRPERQIHVFNTRSGGLGALLAARRICQLHRSGCTFRQTVERVEADILTYSMLFLPGSPESLNRAGLLPEKRPLQGSKWVCATQLDGTVSRVASAWTDAGAEKKLLLSLRERNPEGKVCLLAHCGCPDRARSLSQELLRAGRFSQVLLTESGLITTLLLRQGGMALAF